MVAAVLALVLVAVSHAVRVRVGLNLADEGFLWNGALRIYQGKIPIRDYKSYDPGRFYWVWAWMHLFGRGILGLRRSVAAFQVLGLWAGLTAIGTQTDSIPLLALAGAVLVLWMLPRHKIFEHAMSLITLLALTLLIQSPTVATAFGAGLAVGFGAFMGRNHGIYGFAATGSALLLLTLKGAVDQPAAMLGFWVLGIVVGYAPMLGMFLFVPNMFRRYLDDKVLVFVSRGGIDLTLPIPWPWRLQGYAGLSLLNGLSRFFAGLHFLVLPLFYLGTLGWAVVSPQGLNNACLIAACLTGLFYMHHATSRSDVNHLCQVTQPFLVALFALVFAAQAPALIWLTPPVLFVIGLLVIRPIEPRLQMLETPDRFVAVDVLGEKIFTLRGMANQLNSIRHLIDTHLPASDRLFIAPMGALLYPFLQKETPVHSDFLHFPEGEKKQDEIIRNLADNQVNWALVQNSALDKRDELMFKNTHPKVWAYLESDFLRLQPDTLHKKWSFWQRKADMFSPLPSAKPQAEPSVKTDATKNSEQHT